MTDLLTARRWALAAALLVLAGTSTAAAPVGPVRPEAFRWKLGADAGCLFARDLDLETNHIDEFTLEERYAFLARIQYGVAEDWEVYGRIGAASMKVKDDGDLSGTPDDFFDMGTEAAWGVGLQGIAARDFFVGFDVAVDAQYLSHPGHDGTIESGLNVGTSAANWDASEWSISLLFQSNVEPYVLYFGPTFGHSKISRAEIGGRGAADLEADENAGAVVGLGFDFIGRGTAYFEGRFIEESAANFGFLWTF